jgi:TorA maturation chaperone TorD
MPDDLRCWIYSRLPELFVDIPRPLEPPPPDAGGSHPATRRAVDALGRALALADPAALAEEQVRLFVNAPGGVPAPPYASWYLDGTILGPSTALVAEAYAGQCLAAAVEGGPPPDYLPTELEFLHFLCRHQEAARATGDAPALVAARDAETRFLQAHFFRWVPRVASAIHDAAPGPVFARVADVLAAFCAEEAYRPARLTPEGWAASVTSSMDRSAHPLRSDRALGPRRG